MPLSPSETRALLARINHFPRRALGQNFLVDGNIVRKSLELADVRPGDTVVEIGPGLGTLTEALLEAGATVWAVERDARLAQLLRDTVVPRFPHSLLLTEGDALEFPLAGWTPADPAHPRAVKIVANLPYAISTPWMDAVLGGSLPERMVLMLQKEAADRYAAPPGSKTFGAISIFLQSAYAAAPGHPVAAACFHPRPEVDSCLVNLHRLPEPFIFPRATRDLIREVFQHRRKQLGALLRGRLPDDGRRWFEATAIDPRARAEQVPIRAWQQLPAASA
jgi:16S rRNA (adenine1518-N6/adenine1519-N6)-dimethyltransferase